MARVIRCPKCDAAIDVASVLDVGKDTVTLLAAGEVIGAECYACNGFFFIRPVLDWNVGLTSDAAINPPLTGA